MGWLNGDIVDLGVIFDQGTSSSFKIFKFWEV